MELVSKYVKDTKKTFYGVRIYLKSHPDLHHSEEDNDENAVTIWGPRQMIREVAARISDATRVKVNDELHPNE